MKPTRLAAAAVALLSLAATAPAVPLDPAELKAPISFAEMEKFLADSAARRDFITVTTEGQSVEGRAIHLVRLRRGNHPDPFKVFFIGVQHGNEPAGKDALLIMIRRIAENPELLPEDIDLYILPAANPDGSEAYRRTNSNRMDINRDHILLSQPETQTLHRVARRIRPHLAVDCHEFGRDSSDYRDLGWNEWPLIMMDTANNPVMNRARYDVGLEWVHSAQPAMDAAGFNYTRYFVGEPPTKGEQRFSTLEIDDARNGLSGVGAVSLIIESGVMREAENQHADLPERVAAYLVLLNRFLSEDTLKEATRKAVALDAKGVPPYIPVNSFWGNVRGKVSTVKVYDSKTGELRHIETPDFMTDIVVKRHVVTPRAYVVAPEAAAVFAPWLDRHGLVYTTTTEPMEALAEATLLKAIEDTPDPVYTRFAGRAVTEPREATRTTFAPGALVVSLDQERGRHAAALLEPRMMYGVYQYPEFRAMVAGDGTMPVWRLMAE
jgi:hypothetical protein